jgi:hypothetical protein
MKNSKKYLVLYKSGGFAHCPFCDRINDDTSEMIDHIEIVHNKECELRIVKDMETGDVLHLAELKAGE